MKFEADMNPDWITIKIIGNSKAIARIDLYYWNILKELGIDLRDFFRIALGGNG